MTRTRLSIQPLAIDHWSQTGSETQQTTYGLQKDPEASPKQISPEWTSPKATSSAGLAALSSAVWPPSKANLSPVVASSYRIEIRSPPCWKPQVPTEIWDLVAQECANYEDADASLTLLSLSLTCKATHYPAQRALVRHLTVEQPINMERLTTTLLRKPALGRSTRSLTIKLRRSVAGQVSNKVEVLQSSHAQELALLRLLPLLARIRHLRVECEDNFPETLAQLLTCTLPEVKTVTVASSYGYNRLVYCTTACITRLATGWKNLDSLALSMPWVINNPRGRDYVLGQSRANPSTLRSLEMSGFRGSPSALKELLELCKGTLRRLIFDCPIDEEPWYELERVVNPLQLQLEELSMWSWTMALPAADILQGSPSTQLRKLTLVTPALEDAVAHLPLSLQELTLCTHPEFAPFDQMRLAELLGRHAAKPKSCLRRIHVYNPSADDMDFAVLQAALAKYSIQVERCAEAGTL